MLDIQQLIALEFFIGVFAFLAWKCYSYVKSLSEDIIKIEGILYDFSEKLTEISDIASKDRKELLDIIRNTNQDVYERIIHIERELR
jgi:hypothetical protein